MSIRISFVCELRILTYLSTNNFYERQPFHMFSSYLRATHIQKKRKLSFGTKCSIFFLYCFLLVYSSSTTLLYCGSADRKTTTKPVSNGALEYKTLLSRKTEKGVFNLDLELTLKTYN